MKTVTISEELLNLMTDTIAQQCPWAVAETVFERMREELTPQQQIIHNERIKQ